MIEAVASKERGGKELLLLTYSHLDAWKHT